MILTFSLGLGDADIFEETSGLYFSNDVMASSHYHLVSECLEFSFSCLLFGLSLLIHSCKKKKKPQFKSDTFMYSPTLKILVSPSTWQQESLQQEMDKQGTEKCHLYSCQFMVITCRTAFVKLHIPTSFIFSELPSKL